MSESLESDGISEKDWCFVLTDKAEEDEESCTIEEAAADSPLNNECLEPQVGSEKGSQSEAASAEESPQEMPRSITEIAYPVADEYSFSCQCATVSAEESTQQVAEVPGGITQVANAPPIVLDYLFSCDSSTSSDLDIIDENADDVDVHSASFIDSPLDLSAICPSDIMFHQHFGLNQRSSVSTQSISDGSTQTESPEHTISPPDFDSSKQQQSVEPESSSLIGSPHTADNEKRSANGLPSRVRHILQTEFERDNPSVVSLLVFVAVIIFVPVSFKLIKMMCSSPDGVAVALNDIHHSIQTCLDKQHLEAVNIDDGFEHSKMCRDLDKKYLTAIEQHLNAEVMSFLSDAQRRLFKGEETDGTTLKWEVDISLIVRQLEYYKILPLLVAHKDVDDKTSIGRDEKEIVKSTFREILEEENFVDQMREVIANLTLVNKELRSQFEDENLQPKKLPLSDQAYANLETGKIDNKLLQSNAENFVKTDRRVSGSCSNVVSELQEKIRVLLLENEKLKNEIADFGCSSSTLGSTSSNSHCHMKEKIVNSASQKRENKTVEDKARNFTTQQLSTIESLIKQIESIRGSLSDSDDGVKNWNAFIENVAHNLKEQFVTKTDEDNSQWSWQEMREHVENVILDAQKDIGNIFSDCVEENKKHAEYLLNVVNDYFKVTREKTNRLLKEQMPKVNVNSAFDSIWSMWSGVKDQWFHLKDNVHQMAKNIRNHAKEFKKEQAAAQDNENWYFRNAKEQHEDDSTSADASSLSDERSDWLFSRAADREKHRQQSTEMALNWYLRRKIHRGESKKREGKVRY